MTVLQLALQPPLLALHLLLSLWVPPVRLPAHQLRVGLPQQGL